MGAIKDNPYTEIQYNLSLIGRAMAHPVRIQVMELLMRDNYPIRNIDLAKMVMLAPSSIKDYLEKLKDAQFINVTYDKHYYEISLNKNGVRWCDQFGI